MNSDLWPAYSRLPIAIQLWRGRSAFQGSGRTIRRGQPRRGDHTFQQIFWRLGPRSRSAAGPTPDHAPSDPSKIVLHAVDRQARAAQNGANRIDLPVSDLGRKDAVGCQESGQIRADRAKGFQAVDTTVHGTPR